jgi:hypothetical protein
VGRGAEDHFQPEAISWLRQDCHVAKERHLAMTHKWDVLMTPPKFLPIRGALAGASSQQNSPVNSPGHHLKGIKTISLVRALRFRAAREYTTIQENGEQGSAIFVISYLMLGWNRKMPLATGQGAEELWQGWRRGNKNLAEELNLAVWFSNPGGGIFSHRTDGLTCRRFEQDMTA